MRHTLSILVENRCGELSRILSPFTARGCNIKSLTVAETADPSVSHITLVTNGEDHAIEQIVKRLDKQVRVLQVVDVTGLKTVERELALISVKAEVEPALLEVLKLVSLNRARLTGVSKDNITLEATGNWDQVTEIIRLLSSLGILEIARTGTVTIPGPAQAPAESQVSRAELTAG